MYGIQKNNERFFKKTSDTNVKMQDSLEEDYEETANEAFLEYTEGQYSFFADQHEENKVGQELVFNTNEFDNLDTIGYWQGYIAEIQRLPIEARFDPRLKLLEGKSQQVLDAKKFKSSMVEPQKNTLTEAVYQKLLAKLNIKEGTTLAASIKKQVNQSSFTTTLQRTNIDHLAA
jgi:hypothetical protein